MGVGVEETVFQRHFPGCGSAAAGNQLAIQPGILDALGLPRWNAFYVFLNRQHCRGVLPVHFRNDQPFYAFHILADAIGVARFTGEV